MIEKEAERVMRLAFNEVEDWIKNRTSVERLQGALSIIETLRPLLPKTEKITYGGRPRPAKE